MIIFDDVGHMVSTESEAELHQFAKALGLKRAWYQNHKDHPHYDLTTPGMRNKAGRFGATQVSQEELLKRAWWYETSWMKKWIEK